MIYAYKEQNEEGNYQTSDGTRYLVHTARRVHGARRACWREYESLEAALAEMKLEPCLCQKMRCRRVKLLTNLNNYERRT